MALKWRLTTRGYAADWPGGGEARIDRSLDNYRHRTRGYYLNLPGSSRLPFFALLKNAKRYALAKFPTDALDKIGD